MVEFNPRHETNILVSNPLAAPLLAGAILLFCFTFLALAKTIVSSEATYFFVLAVGISIPLFGLGLARWVGQLYLLDWFWGSFVISMLAGSIQLEQYLLGASSPMVWGIGSALSLGIAIFANSRISLLMTSGILVFWCVYAYTSNPPADFLWPSLLIQSLGLAWAWRQNNLIAAIGFVISLVIWTGFTAQAAMVLRAAGSAQIALAASLFLGVCCLLLLVLRGKKNNLGWDELILIGASATIAGFAFSPFASFLPNPTQSTALVNWILLIVILFGLGLILVVKLGIKKIDKAGVFILMGLIVLAVFAPLAPLKPWWWDGLGGGVLSVAGIWLSSRGFAAASSRTGFVGLAIWAVSVLLSSNGLEQPWLRVGILGLYSFTDVGFYLLAERQSFDRSEGQGV